MKVEINGTPYVPVWETWDEVPVANRREILLGLLENFFGDCRERSNEWLEKQAEGLQLRVTDSEPWDEHSKSVADVVNSIARLAGKEDCIQIDYSKDGNQEELECSKCVHWQYGHDEFNDVKCCHNGSYRGSGKRRITHPHGERHLAPDWCPRRMKNHRCTCGICPQCTLSNAKRNSR